MSESMLTQIIQLDERLQALFAADADPDPEEIQYLIFVRQQTLGQVLPFLSEEGKKTLHDMTESLLLTAQKARARYALTLFQHKRSQKGVKAYQAVSLQ